MRVPPLFIWVATWLACGAADSRRAAPAGHGQLAPDHAASRAAPRVGASVAVHPPKFPLLGSFLEQRAACPAARESMSLHAVFSTRQDYEDFQRQLARNRPLASSTPGTWVGIVADIPDDVTAMGNQKIAAWKKWYGIASMMDLGTQAPEYGLMMDAELGLYDAKDCGANSSWHGLLERLQEAEASKLWPVAQVGNSTTYHFPWGMESGREYDRELILENAMFVTKGSLNACSTAQCKILKDQIELSQFSWWTDLPYVNLRVAGEMILAMAGPRSTEAKVADPRRWQQLARGISFPRFEHMAYQQWCVLHEGYRFRDVTNITGQAKWASYLEDPPKGANIAALHPLWVSAETVSHAEHGDIPPLNEAERPLLVFHVDHVGNTAKALARRWDRAAANATEGLPAAPTSRTVRREPLPGGGPANLLAMEGRFVPSPSVAGQALHAQHWDAVGGAAAAPPPIPAWQANKYFLLFKASCLAAVIVAAALLAYSTAFRYLVLGVYLALSVSIDLCIAFQRVRAAPGSGTPPTATYNFDPVCAVLLTEAVKLLISLALFAVSSARGEQTERWGGLTFSDAKWLSLPALIFTANNVLVWWAIGKNDVSVFGVFRDTMIIWTALMWRGVFQTPLGSSRLTAIAIIFLGLAVNRASSMATGHAWTWSFLWVMAMTLCNALGSVANEFALKRNRRMDTNVQNCVLYVVCIALLLALLLVTSPHRLTSLGSFFAGFTEWTFATSCLQAFAGLMVSRLLKYTDSVYKTAGSCLRGPLLVLIAGITPGITTQHDILTLCSAAIVAWGCFRYLSEGPVQAASK